MYVFLISTKSINCSLPWILSRSIQYLHSTSELKSIAWGALGWLTQGSIPPLVSFSWPL